MGLVFRAFVSAVLSDSAMQTELGFASTLGPSLFVALIGLAAVLLSFTYMDPVTKKTTVSANMFRMGMGLVSIYGAYDFGFGHYTTYAERISRQVYSGISTISLYIVMRVIDASFVTLFLGDGPPRWVSTSSNIVLPMPTTFGGRIAYTLDLLTSMRGSSWYSDRRWHFTSSLVISQQARLSQTSRWQYTRTQLLWMIWFYFLIDLIDTGVKLIDFDPVSIYPVSGDLPISQQLICSIGIGLWIYLSLAFEHGKMSLMFIGLLGVSKPVSWPPLFEYPFLGSSLSDFWGKRWHYMFRRTFDRLLAPFLPPPPPKLSKYKKEDDYSSVPTAKQGVTVERNTTPVLIRAGAAFILTTLLHLIVIHRNVPTPLHPYEAFWDPCILLFFLAQPIGIALDVFLCRLLRASGVGQRGVAIARRAFVWGWLLWTARWWADSWVRKGLWHKTEQFVLWSPVRGLLWGDWFVQGGPQ